MAKKKKQTELKQEPVATKNVEQPSVAIKLVANDKWVTFYGSPSIEDRKGLIGYGQIIEPIDYDPSSEWVKYQLEGKTLYSLASHFVKL